MHPPLHTPHLCAAALWLAAGAAAAQELRLGTGVDCSQGRYGTAQEVGVCMLPHHLHLVAARYELKLSLPYIRVDAGLPGQQVSGYGDASLHGAVVVAEDLPGVDALEVGMKVKARNGSVDRGLGNGRMAHQLGLGTVSFVGARHLVLLYTGLTHGQRPDRQTGAYATAWYKFFARPGLRLGVLYENNEIGWSQRIETLALMPEVAVGSHWTLKPFAYVGLNSFAPDRGIGLVSSYRLR